MSDFDELPEEARERARQIEADLRQFAEDSVIGVPQDPAKLAEQIEDGVRRQLEDGLRIRAVPEEWWRPFLPDVEAQVVDMDGVQMVTVDMPEEIREWMGRLPVFYRPGQAPV